MAPHETVPTLMHKLVSAVVGQAAPEFRRHGLNVQAARVMVVLLQSPGIRPGELSAQAAVDTSTLSHMLRKLEGAGLVLRERIKADERAVNLHLTRKGASVAASCQQLALSHERQLLRLLSAGEVTVLRGLLGKLKEGLLERPPAELSQQSRRNA